MSFAKIGSSAVTLPSSMANRSSEMAPSTTGWLRMNAKPANSDSIVTGRRSCTWPCSFTSPISTLAIRNSVAQVR